jgi:uncharacterized membrane protein
VPDTEPDEADGPGGLEAAEVVDAEIASDNRRLIASAEFSGPLPPPNVLREYDRVKPGLADIIVSQWQSETAHRHKTIDSLTEIDREVVRDYSVFQRRGQWLGFGALGLICAVTALALVLDRDTAAIGGIVLAASYAIAAIWRGYGQSPGPPPADVANGNEIEQASEPS